ncbi:MAG TPA: hypothetical protein PKE69_20970 [Pyrinomonadaceae bacterium]|nr:hypothetical protein [Pyrinomonadaceae bacterium]
MLKILSLTIALTFFLTACGDKTVTNTNANANNTSAGSPAANNTNVNTNQPKNTTPVANSKPVDNSPKRISFNKGANWGAVNITLAAGEAQKFVVSAKSGQSMDVEASSKETSINLIKGKAETTEDFGFLNAVLVSNGDYVFEVRNSTKKEIKTSVKVTIVGEEQYQRGVLNDVDEEKDNE